MRCLEMLSKSSPTSYELKTRSLLVIRFLKIKLTYTYEVQTLIHLF